MLVLRRGRVLGVLGSARSLAGLHAGGRLSCFRARGCLGHLGRRRVAASSSRRRGRVRRPGGGRRCAPWSLLVPNVVGERADHEDHDRHAGDERKREDAADSPSVLNLELTRQPRLAERTETCCKPGIVSGEIALHLIKDALFILRQGHSATSREMPTCGPTPRLGPCIDSLLGLCGRQEEAELQLADARLQPVWGPESPGHDPAMTRSALS